MFAPTVPGATCLASGLEVGPRGWTRVCVRRQGQAGVQPGLWPAAWGHGDAGTPCPSPARLGSPAVAQLNIPADVTAPRGLLGLPWNSCSLPEDQPPGRSGMQSDLADCSHSSLRRRAAAGWASWSCPPPPPPPQHTHTAVPTFMCVHVTHAFFLSLRLCLSPPSPPPKAKRQTPWAGSCPCPLPLGAPVPWVPLPLDAPGVLSTEYLPFRARCGAGGGAGPGCVLQEPWPCSSLGRTCLLSRCPCPPPPAPQAAQSRSTPEPAWLRAPATPRLAEETSRPPRWLGLQPQSATPGPGFGPKPWPH